MKLGTENVGWANKSGSIASRNWSDRSHPIRSNEAFKDPCASVSLVKKNLKNLDLLIAGKKTSKISSTIVKIVDNELILIRQGKLILKDYVNQ